MGSRIELMASALVLSAVFSSYLGCVDDEMAADEDGIDEGVDGINESFLSGKDDGWGLEPGSELETQLLCEANTLSFEELDESWGVSLDVRAAEGIVARRPFSSLVELDAVPWVGPRAFGKLITYAERAGCAGAVIAWPEDPFDPTFCTGDASLEDIARSVPVDQRSPYPETHRAEYRVVLRARECPASMGCREWSDDVRVPDFFYPAEGLETLSGDLRIFVGEGVTFQFFTGSAWAISGVGQWGLDSLSIAYTGYGYSTDHPFAPAEASVQPGCMVARLNEVVYPASLARGPFELQTVIYGVW